MNLGKKPWVVMDKGRIGRLRYIAYTVAFGLACLPGILIADIFTAQGHETVGMILGLVTQAIVIILNIMLAIRRLHDFDASGWWALLVIPLAFFDPPRMVGPEPTPAGILSFIGLLLILSIYVLILLFRPGNFDANRFGPAPAPNTAWVMAGASLALIMPIVAYGLVIVVQRAL